MKKQRLFTLMVQRQSDLPWNAQLAFERKQQECEDDILRLVLLRKFVSVMVLLQHYCDHASWKRLVCLGEAAHK